MNLKSFQDSVEDIGKKLDPDDDWMPVLFLEKDKEVAVIGMMMMDNNETKNMCAKMITTVISLTNPDSACFITTAWMSTTNDAFKDASHEEINEAYRQGYIPPPSQDPDRIEIVSAVCIGVRGENDGEGFMIGEIERHTDKAPTIKKWDVHQDGDLHLTGRFADAMKKGFASVDKNGDLSKLSKLKGLADGSDNTE